MKKFVQLLLILSLSQYSISGQTNSILIDFGNISSASPWNNIENPHGGTTQLVDIQGISTDLTLTVVDSFNFINTNGTTQPEFTLGIPSTASGDSFYGNLIEFADDTQPSGAVQLANLDPSKEYTIKLFASRLADDNRETLYTLSGATETQLTLNAANNTNQVVEASVFPAIDGMLEIVATAGENNTNPNKFYYLGALILEFEDENFTQELSLKSPNGGEYWQVGKEVEIQLINTIEEEAQLEYSNDNGSTWNSIGSLPPLIPAMLWIVPDAISEQCLVRVTAPSYSDISESAFTISGDTDQCPIVVIGSSTAEGIGATVQDSAWVYRYESELYQNDTRYPVINLGRGGYSTYHLLPTGSTAGASVGVTVDTEKNITKALSFNPSSIIINLPSNDAANFFPVSDQMDNFRAMTTAAEDEGVATWVCTTQPRNFGNAEQIALQIEGRDSILNYYGEQAIDFWNGIADANGNILASLNSGDGVHLNDQGHGVLFDKVVELNLPSLSNCAGTGTSVSEVSNTTQSNLFTVTPNPVNSQLSIKFNRDLPRSTQVSIIRINGQVTEIDTAVSDISVGAVLKIQNVSIDKTDELFYIKVESTLEDGQRVIQVEPVVRTKK